MGSTGKRTFPRWLFTIIAIAGLLASGIYLGIMLLSLPFVLLDWPFFR